MHHLTFYYDVLSPYGYLAFARLPEVLMGLSVQVDYKPASLGVLLRAKNMLGPAEVEHKRDWVYRQSLWLASRDGVTMAMPKEHPFNPMTLMRLGLCCAHPSAPGLTSRYVTQQLLDHVWQGGEAANDPARLAALTERLKAHNAERGQPWQEPNSDAIKAQLRANTDEAIADGIFGVPTIRVDGRNFWGYDALPMLRAYLEGDAWFNSGDWEAVSAVPSGLPPRT